MEYYLDHCILAAHYSQWLLQVLSNPRLAMDHPYPVPRTLQAFYFHVRPSKWIDSGIEEVNNHSCYCAIHIARNVENLCSRRWASWVHELAKTFSHMDTTRLLEMIANTWRKGRNTWRKYQVIIDKVRAWKPGSMIMTQVGHFPNV